MTTSDSRASPAQQQHSQQQTEEKTPWWRKWRDWGRLQWILWGEKLRTARNLDEHPRPRPPLFNENEQIVRQPTGAHVKGGWGTPDKKEPPEGGSSKQS